MNDKFNKIIKAKGPLIFSDHTFCFKRKKVNRIKKMVFVKPFHEVLKQKMYISDRNKMYIVL